MRIELEGGAYIDAHIAKTSRELTMPPRPAVVVFPGGAYSFCSAREAEPVANQFAAAGCNTFCLFYRVEKEAHSKHPLIDAARAVDHIRRHAEEYNIDPQKIAVIGFSAGGHLATWLASAYGDPVLEGLDCRPDAAMAGYALVKSHTGSFRRLLGLDADTVPSDDQMKQFYTDLMVHENTPPMFLWTTFSDEAVPITDTLALSDALYKHNVPFELHIFPHGPHGLSVCTEETTPHGAPQYKDEYIGRWVDMAVKWLNKQFGR